MRTECEMLGNCGFFRKYGRTEDLACRGFVSRYCQGPKMSDCRRMRYRKEHGVPPPDDMLPSGDIITSRAAQSAG